MIEVHVFSGDIMNGGASSALMHFTDRKFQWLVRHGLIEKRREHVPIIGMTKRRIYLKGWAWKREWYNVDGTPFELLREIEQTTDYLGA